MEERSEEAQKKRIKPKRKTVKKRLAEKKAKKERLEAEQKEFGKDPLWKKSDYELEQMWQEQCIIKNMALMNANSRDATKEESHRHRTLAKEAQKKQKEIQLYIE